MSVSGSPAVQQTSASSRWGEGRRALRAAGDRLRVSFFIGVALVPTLLTQLFVGVGGWLPWWGWSALLVAVIAAFFGYAFQADRREQRALRRRLADDPGTVVPVQDLTVITDLVITVDLTKSGPQNLHTLLPALPALRRVYAVAGRPPDQPPGGERELARLLEEVGRRDVHGRVLQSLPAWGLDRAESRQLQSRLIGVSESRAAGAVVAVDLTGGTVPMSLTVYRAAIGAGLPITYTASLPATDARPHLARQFRALVALHDPTGELTGPTHGRQTT